MDFWCYFLLSFLQTQQNQAEFFSWDHELGWITWTLIKISFPFISLISSSNYLLFYRWIQSF
jgi:hypothetical protein